MYHYAYYHKLRNLPDGTSGVYRNNLKPDCEWNDAIRKNNYHW